jgi:hypothetical protein
VYLIQQMTGVVPQHLLIAQRALLSPLNLLSDFEVLDLGYDIISGNESPP